MAEGLAEPSPKGRTADVASAVAAAVAPADPLLGKRIEFHLERKPYSPVSSSRNFHLETLNPSTAQPRTTPLMGAAGPASAAAGQQSGRKSDGGLDPVLSFRITFRRIGAGLQNLGNTCFLNSVLQCLTYTEPFAAYCHSGEHKSSCRTAGFCAMCALQNHVMNALQSTGKILSPFHLVKNLRCISRNFRNSRQEDAHEYMVNLLESMHKCCLPSGVPTESPSAYERSLVHKIFGGRLRSQVRCTQCKYCSNTFDPFLDLSLEIFKADSLKRALAHFTAREQLDGGERQYQCQRCKEKVRAYKQLTVHRAPYVLTIHLKRFGPGITGQKIDKKVDFEPSLDLKPFISDQQEGDLKYTLYGVLVHAGWSTHSGHYYCFVRTSSGMWHSLDDNQVKPVSEKTVLAQKAYMLFYVRDSSAIKRSVDVVHTGNMLANTPSSKVIPQPASILNGAIQNAERKLSVSECSSAKSKADGTFHGQTISVLGNSSGEPLSMEAASMPKNGNAIQKASCSQANGEALSNGLLLTTLSKDSRKLENPPTDTPLVITSSHNQEETKDFSHPFHFKENGAISTSHVNAASFSCEREVVQEKSGLYNGKVGSSIVAAQPTNSGLLNLQMHSKNLLRQNNLHNEGTTNGFSQNNDIPCSMGVVRASDKTEQKMFGSQLTCANGYIGKKDFDRIPLEHQNILPEDKSMANLQCKQGGESLLKVEESGLNTSEKNLRYAKGCIQPEAVAVTDRERSVGKCSQMELKRKKLGRAFQKGQYFGRKQLFLTSLFLHKKKHKRSKKCRLSSKKFTKDKVIENLHIDDQGGIHTDDLGVSTSEAIKVVDVPSAGASKKLSWSSSNRENNVETGEDRKYCNGDFVHNSGNPDRSSKIEVMLATSDQSRSPRNSTENMCNGREADACGKGPDQKGVTSLLMTLKQTTVPRWDDVELPTSQSHDLDNVRSRSIGYVLDEWDVEYDQGRRKKVKKSHHSFGGPNPFQEIANMKVQQRNMKMKEYWRGQQF